MTKAKTAASGLAKRLGMPLTFRNLYVIEKAIDSETALCGSVSEAVEIIYEPAMNELFRGRVVNYFFFEDARWRSGEYGTRRLKRLAEEAREKFAQWRAPDCFTCEDTGEIWNHGPGPRKLPCPDCESEGIHAPRTKSAEASA